MGAENINPLSDLDLGQTVRGLVPGQKVLNRFTLQRVLGRGGMGVVWLAHDDALDFDVALKFLPEVLAKDRAAVEELKREARRSLELAHPNIVKFYYFFQDENCAGISMEYVAGDTLGNLRLQRPGKVFDAEDLQGWTQQLCLALQYAHHDVKIVHRDLKPANLMADAQGRLKVTDFGIARSVTDSLTRTMAHRGGVAGTLVYMSAQQAMGEAPAVADDIYSVGATLYELMTGKPPFFSGEILAQVREKVPPSLLQRRKELGIEGKKIPAFWERAIAACLHKDPAQRPASAMELMERLQLGGHPQSLAAPVRPAVVPVLSPEEPTMVEKPSGPASPKTPAAPKPAPKGEAKPPSKPKRTGTGRGRGVLIEFETELAGPSTASKPPSTLARPTAPPARPTEPPEKAVEPPKSSASATGAEGAAQPAAQPPESNSLPPVVAPLPQVATTPPAPARLPELKPATTAPPTEPPLVVSGAASLPGAGSVPETVGGQAAAPPTSSAGEPVAAPDKVAENVAGLEAGLEVEEAVPAPAKPWMSTETADGWRRGLKVMVKAAALVVMLALLSYGGVAGWHYYQTLRNPPGRLVVKCEPADAQMALTGVRKYAPSARKPEFEKVVPGDYELMVSRPGYHTATNQLRLEGQSGSIYARHKVVPVKLRPVTGVVEIRPVPADAVAVITPVKTTADLAPAAVTNRAPGVVENLPVGSYEVRIARAGYRGMSTNVVVAEGSPVVVAPHLAPSVGALQITSAPVPARFVLTGPEGDRREGECPATLTNLPTGTYRLSMEAANYGGFVTNVQVMEDRVGLVEGALSRLQGELQFACNVAAARFELQGPVRLQGTLDGEFRQKLPVGEYQLILRAAGYYARTQAVVIAAEEVADLRQVALARITGWLIVHVEPAAALLTVDADRRLAPGGITELPAGVHEVRAELPGYETVMDAVRVAERQTNRHTIKLARSVGSVVFRVEPAEATNYLHYVAREGLPGRDVTNAPSGRRLELPAGEYVLEVGLARHRPAQRRVVVAPHATNDLGIVALEPLRGGLAVAFAPAQAVAVLKPVDVRGAADVKNQQAGTLNLASNALLVGTYELSLMAPGFSNHVERITVREDVVTVLPKLTLGRLVGGLEVTGLQPSGATVRVKGPQTLLQAGEAVNQERRRAPGERGWRFGPLPTGTYTVVATAPGHEEAARQVEIRAGATEAVALGALARSAGALAVATAPAEGRLRVEMLASEAGNPAEFAPREGVAPVIFAALPTGRYRVSATRTRQHALPGLAAGAWSAAGEALVERGATNRLVLEFPFARVTVVTEPPGARLLQGRETLVEAGQPALVLGELGLEERVALLARLPNYRPTNFVLDARALGLRPQASLTVTQALQFWPGPQAEDRVWTNSLGMKFVNLNQKVFVCVWETRVQDYTNVLPSYTLPDRSPYEELERGTKESEERGRIHRAPIVNVSWHRAKEFCERLQSREAGHHISANFRYRLPTDEEWSLAAGLPVEQGATPRERSGRLGPPYFDWGAQFPPPVSAGNYPAHVGYDYFEKVAPVGMFAPNALGIFDLGGNVWEWCEDAYDAKSAERVLRGGSWKWDVVEQVYPDAFLASFRRPLNAQEQGDNIGFRVVLEITDEPAAAPPRPAAIRETPTKAAPSAQVLGMRQALGWGSRGLLELKTQELKPNLTAARTEWEKAARAGDAEAKFRVWYLVHNQLSARRGDEALARSFLQEAAEQGLAPARLEYARHLYDLTRSGNLSSDRIIQHRNDAIKHCEALLRDAQGALNPAGGEAARAAFLLFRLTPRQSGGKLGADALKYLVLADALGHWKAAALLTDQEGFAKTNPEIRATLEQARREAMESWGVPAQTGP